MTWNLRRWAALGPIVVALAAAPGCAAMTPKMSVHHAEVRGLSAWGVNVMIWVQVRNDNSFDIQLRNVNVKVTFGRGIVLPVNYSPNQWLPSNRTTFVAVPVTIPLASIPSLAMETAGAYGIQYHVKGSADVTATRTFGIERDDYQVDQGGAVPRQMVIDAAKSVIPLPL